ncbi:hypothetical protein K439DRAFT_1364649, partial [Ramaria rubella]
NILGAEDLWPPTTTCLNTECAGCHLINECKSECQLFTLHQGILPIWATSLYCKNCSTHNYSVTQASAPKATQRYYRMTPSFIQVTAHSYVEADLCHFIETKMAFSHASAQSISRVYNMALKMPGENQSNASTFLKQSMDSELILNAFFLHALLRGHTRQVVCLTLPHNGGHNDRFTNALKERNFRIASTGQEMWGHACNDCAKMYTGQDGKIYHMTAGVTNGITVGHLCCQVHDCKVPLQHPHHRFCPTHRHFNDLCCVKGCSLTVELRH